MKKKLVKPKRKQKFGNMLVLYTSENGNPGCTSCQAGCLNCGCRGNCCS